MSLWAGEFEGGRFPDESAYILKGGARHLWSKVSREAICLKANVGLGLGILLTLLLTASLVLGQESSATLSGTVMDPSGKAVPNAKVSVKNVTTGQATDVQTDAAGAYVVTNLVPGEYEVSASAEGIGAGMANVTLVAGRQQTANLSLAVTPAQQAPPPPPTGVAAENLPNAPSSIKTAPSLEDLGFSPAESQANAREQALLDKRTHMLKIHQRMGLITTAPLLATLITSVNAGGRNTSTSSRDLHVALGALTGDLYGITAYYAIRAPRIPGTETRGQIRLHKTLAWIHGPGMIMTPILGAMAFNQKNNGQKVHGIASAHGPVAIVTAGAFGASLLAVSVKF
jgi:Carboxypeptidase regulatory-like domain